MRRRHYILVATSALALLILAGGMLLSEHIAASADHYAASDAAMFDPRYIGHYRLTQRSIGSATMPIVSEAQLAPDHQFTMTLIPAEWMASGPRSEVIQKCSGTWRIGDDGDGSVTLEFTITSADEKRVLYKMTARAQDKGFYFDPFQSGEYFKQVEEGADEIAAPK